MTTEEKKEAILEAVKSKRVSGNKIEPKRKGATITKLRKGEKVGDKTINKLYDSLLNLLGVEVKEIEAREVKEVEHQEVEHQKVEGEKIMNAIAERFDSIERENTELKEAVEGLQREIEALKKNGITEYNKNIESSIINIIPDSAKDSQQSGLLRDYERLVVKGIDFIIRLESQVARFILASGESKKVEYPKYYAKKKIAGKLHRVYLGEIADRNESIEKIKAYMQKHSLSFSPVV